MTRCPSSALATLTATATALLLTACGDDTDYTAAVEYWAQPDTVVIGIGQPSDMKAVSRDEVWIADLVSATILSVAPAQDRYLRIGMGDREPVEVQLPAKLAVALELGLAAYDAETGSVDLFTLQGEFIRGFEPGFVPAIMSFSREPLGFTFAVAAADSVAEAALDTTAAAGDTAAGGTGTLRRPVVIRTDMQGRDRDTLLSATHGPEALRSAVARPGETSMSPSRTGIWVWSRAEPGTAFHLSPRGTRRLALRPEDAEAGGGLLADPARDMLWVVTADTAGTRYAAYDTRLATELEGDTTGEAATDAPATEAAAAADETSAAADEPTTADGSAAFLGIRTAPRTFRPWVIHDGVVMGVRRYAGALLAIAYDLNADRFERPEADGGGDRGQ